MKTPTNHLPSCDESTNAKLGDFNNNSSFLRKKSFRWMRQVSGGLALSVCYCLLAASGAVAANFSFTKIADSRDFTFLTTGAAINDSGKLAFIATPLTGTQSVYTSDGVQITEIVNLNSLPSLFNRVDIPPQAGVRFFFDSNISINNNDTVAFIGTLAAPIASESRLFVGQNGVSTRAQIMTFGRFGGDRIANFALNNQDELVYFTDTFSFVATGSSLTLTRPNQPNVNIARAFSSFVVIPPSEWFFSIGSFDLNNLGEVTFAATRYQENTLYRPGTSAIFTNDGSSNNTLLEINASALDLNDNGDVVLSNQDAISLFNRATGTLRTIADTTNSFRTFSNPVINNNGSVVFRATLNVGETGIFTGADPIADKVIATGDALAGSTVTNVNFSRQGFNNNGQIAFFAQLADGTSGIFRADPVKDQPPVSIPEGASTLGLITFAVLVGASRVYPRSHV